MTHTECVEAVDRIVEERGVDGLLHALVVVTVDRLEMTREGAIEAINWAAKGLNREDSSSSKSGETK